MKCWLHLFIDAKPAATTMQRIPAITAYVPVIPLKGLKSFLFIDRHYYNNFFFLPCHIFVNISFARSFVIIHYNTIESHSASMVVEWCTSRRHHCCYCCCSSCWCCRPRCCFSCCSYCAHYSLLLLQNNKRDPPLTTTTTRKYSHICWTRKRLYMEGNKLEYFMMIILAAHNSSRLAYIKI